MIANWPRKSWHFNVLNIYNFNLNGPYSFIFDFLKAKQEILGGDILEAGVYRGRMTLSLGIFLKQLNLPGTIHGFDTFQGFPKLSKEDLFTNFHNLFDQDIISNSHYEEIKQLEFYNKEFLRRGMEPDEISSSGRFEDARFDELVRKISLLELDNIILHKGDFENTMKEDSLAKKHFSLVFIDCDLYKGYLNTLNFAWNRLLKGGIVFLDEYYSLKFPGARIAVDEFFSKRNDFTLLQVSDTDDDFERWIVRKNE